MPGVLHSVRITDRDIARAAELCDEVPGLKSWFLALEPCFREDLLSIGKILSEERRRRESVRPGRNKKHRRRP
jgi:hypothetical protein